MRPRTIGATTTREAQGTAKEITLAPGGQATAWFSWQSKSSCGFSAQQVQVIPPNQKLRRRTPRSPMSPITYVEGSGPAEFPVCSRSIDVYPFEAGNSGPHA